VTETPHQLACMIMSVIHMHGTRVDVPYCRLPCTRSGYDLFDANYVIRGCTRLHLCDRNTPPACMHDCLGHCAHLSMWVCGIIWGIACKVDARCMDGVVVA
jgi:hypothetical protein